MISSYLEDWGNCFREKRTGYWPRAKVVRQTLPTWEGATKMVLWTIVHKIADVKASIGR